MSIRNFSAALLLPTVFVAATRGDVFLREDRKLDPSSMALLEVLPRASTDAPLTEKLKTDIEIVVRHAIYPLTDKNNRQMPNRMYQQVAACETKIRAFHAAEVKNTAVQDEIVKRMLTELATILLNPEQEPITRVNTATVLARLTALTGREETSDLLIKVVSDPKQPEGARYWGLVGMRELLTKLLGKGGAGFKNAKSKADMVATLVGYIEREPPFTPTTEAEADGLRYLRREAIRALAEARVVRLTGENGHAALTLARVVGRDKMLKPEPRLDERVEAAIGLCQLASDGGKELQVGYVSYLLGQFTYEFGLAYKDPRRSNRWPWRVFGATLLDSMTGWVNSNDRDPSAKTLGALALKVVEDVEKKSQTLNTGPLGSWVDKNTTGQESVYKSDPKSAVVPGATEK